MPTVYSRPQLEIDSDGIAILTDLDKVRIRQRLRRALEELREHGSGEFTMEWEGHIGEIDRHWVLSLFRRVLSPLGRARVLDGEADEDHYDISSGCIRPTLGERHITRVWVRLGVAIDPIQQAMDIMEEDTRLDFDEDERVPADLDDMRTGMDALITPATPLYSPAPATMVTLVRTFLRGERLSLLPESGATWQQLQQALDAEIAARDAPAPTYTG